MSPSHDPTTVLVVEDEGLLLFSVAEELRDAGFRVLEATNAREAIALLETHPEIRLVFTDVHMPGSMDGLALCAAVRNRWPPIKIIVTSGHRVLSSGELPDGGLFMPKPYSTERVISSMREMLG